LRFLGDRLLSGFSSLMCRRRGESGWSPKVELSSW
jgi:hypothetical protein